MKFAQWVFRIAGVYGILVVAPLYFMEDRLGACRVTPGSSLRLSPAESVSDRLPSFFP